MNTKEAVKWIFNIWHEWENLYDVDGERVLKEGNKMYEVIELLKRGKKFEKMWEEIVSDPHVDLDLEEYLKYLGEIKQKYFPKEVIKIDQNSINKGKPKRLETEEKKEI